MYKTAANRMGEDGHAATLICTRASDLSCRDAICQYDAMPHQYPFDVRTLQALRVIMGD
jgi:hypothetical protein